MLAGIAIGFLLGVAAMLWLGATLAACERRRLGW